MAEIKLPIVIDGVKTIEELANRALGVDIIRLASTNADRIRAMSDEELAEAIEKFSYKVITCPKEKCHLEPISIYESLDRSECRRCWLGWLKSPVEKEAKE